jgi:hypothetical protein
VWPQNFRYRQSYISLLSLPHLISTTLFSLSPINFPLTSLFPLSPSTHSLSTLTSLLPLPFFLFFARLLFSLLLSLRFFPVNPTRGHPRHSHLPLALSLADLLLSALSSSPVTLTLSRFFFSHRTPFHLSPCLRQLGHALSYQTPDRP